MAVVRVILTVAWRAERLDLCNEATCPTMYADECTGGGLFCRRFSTISRLKGYLAVQCRFRGSMLCGAPRHLLLI